MSAILEKAALRLDLHSRKNRAHLAHLVTRLFERWALDGRDHAILPGLSPGSRSTINRYRQGEPLADNADLIGRAGHLLGIHKTLRINFSHERDRDLAYRWINTPNRRFDNRMLIEIMRQGFEGILAVRRYLDFERGR